MRVSNFNSKVPQGGIYPHIKFERDPLNTFRLRVLTSSGSTGGGRGRGGGGGGAAKTITVLTLATRMFVINEKLFLFAIVDRYPFATCAKDIFV